MSELDLWVPAEKWASIANSVPSVPWLTYVDESHVLVTPTKPVRSTPRRDVVDEIDELAAEEKCPHCDRAWHQLPLTSRVLQMYQSGRLDPNYFSTEDHSPVVCEGSTFIGPRCIDRKPKWANGGVIHSPPMSSVYMSTVMDMSGFFNPFFNPLGSIMKTMAESLEKLFDTEILKGGLALDFKSWFVTVSGETTAPPPAYDGELPDVDIEFGPQNWLLPKELGEPIKAPADLSTAVTAHWNMFLDKPIELPESPGYDFSAFGSEEPKYPTSKGKKK